MNLLKSFYVVLYIALILFIVNPGSRSEFIYVLVPLAIE